MPGSNTFFQGTDIEQFAEQISNSIKNNYRVAIGFECPLYLPIKKDPIKVNSSRKGEGNRSWSAAAGMASLATGIVEVIWILNKISSLLEYYPKAELVWENFISSNSIFFWEAFITSTSKGSSHTEDAKIAIKSFKSSLPDLPKFNALQEDNVFSLVGAAALRTSWSNDIKILSNPCIVIKA